MHRVWAIIRKEFIQISRDRRSLGIIVVLPMVQLLLMGYAVNTVIDHIPTVISDQTNDIRSRELVQAFGSTTYFTVLGYVDSPAEARRAVDRGDAKVAVIIPPDYSTQI